VQNSRHIQYESRFERVLDFIDEHLSQDLSVEVLSNVAAFSPFHFHRQFSSFFGISTASYVRLKRLKRAAYILAYRDTPITTIALDSAYESPEAFSRVFKSYFQQTPTAFRAQPSWDIWHKNHNPRLNIKSLHMTREFTPQDIDIIDFTEIKIAAFEHCGPPENLPQSIRSFIAWRKQNALPPQRHATYNILYDDPAITPPNEYRFDICVATNTPISDNTSGIVMKSIPAGPCARLSVFGSEEKLKQAIIYLYAHWLPQSKKQTRDFPLFLQRVSFFPDVSEHKAQTDIFLPIT
jgi:AraC family transcriptional regulator